MVNLLSQYWQTIKGNTEVREKLLTLNCNISKTERRGKFKFGENAFQAFSYILAAVKNLT